jgi:mono/diheme cytochrome c family protein
MTRAALVRRTCRAALLAVVLACGAAPPVATPVAQTTVAAPGEVIAAVEIAGARTLFTRDLAITPSATVPAPPGGWAEAIAMPALDGEGRWVVARSGDGALWRVTDAGDLEPICDRLGLPPQVRSIAAFAPPGPVRAHAGASSAAPDAFTVAIGLPDGVAILRDRAHVARYPAAPGVVAAGRDRVAIRRAGAVDVWDLAAQRAVTYRVPGATGAAFVADALVIATRDALYREAGGALHRLAVPGLRAIAPAGSRLWLVTARGPAWLAGDAVVPVAAAADHLIGLDDGDAIASSATRTAVLGPARRDDDPRWTAEVRPIVERVCLGCHGPGGRAGVDLSTAAAWRADRAELVRRVVTTRTMPPAGTALAEPDRRLLAAWLAHPSPP